MNAAILRFTATALLVLAPALATVMNASPAEAASGQSLSATAGFTAGYDDNILEYSDSQLRSFEAGTHPLRFAIQTTDDMIYSPSLALTWELDEGRGRRHALRIRGEGDSHAKNSIADFHSFSASWRESFRRDRRLSVGYFVLPDYYLRQLRDEDLPAALGDSRYRGARFDLQIATASWRQRAGRGREAGLAYRFERRRYNPEFQERNAGLHEGDLSLDWTRLPRRGDVGLHAGYRVSSAQATDGDEVGGVRDDDDLSYHGLTAGIDGRMELARTGPWRLGGDLGYWLETRSYESTLPTDRYHFGRSDLLHAIEVGLRVGYRPHWAMRGSFRFEDNTAHLSTLAPPTSDSGSYRVNQVNLALEWSGGLWHEAPEPEEGEE